MALIQCPECKSDVSSFAAKCPHCGYPLEDYAKELEIKRLTNKILPCKFTVPEPRAKVCIKCADSFQYVNPKLSSFKKPMCTCGMPGVEVDYTQIGLVGWESEFYVFQHCCVPRNIGDTESQEYIEHAESFKKYEEHFNTTITPKPPDPKNFGVKPEDYWNDRPDHALRAAVSLPRCPFCKSTDLTKITAAKKALKGAIFGLFWAIDDAGKTYKCNNCGGKF